MTSALRRRHDNSSTLCTMDCSSSDTPKRPCSQVEIPIHPRVEEPKTKKRRITRRKNVGVRFSEPLSDVHFSPPSPLSKISKEDAKSLWYQHDEIRLSKLQARAYILGLPMKSETTRGLERFDRDRVENKALAIKCTLKASRCGYAGKDLANLAKQCSSSARQQAILTGCDDFCSVYHPT